MKLLTVNNLAVRLANKTIIENISFDLAANETLSILGPNGSGKTVLLKALLNLTPYSGEITWSPQVRIGYVPQKIEADRHLPLTYKDLFISKCKILKIRTEVIDRIGASVGLSKETLELPVGHLSGGYFQRGLIAFALLGEPNVLLLDEPTASVDEPGEEHIYELIRRLQRQYGLAIIVVSHDLSFVYRYASRVLCLNKQSLCIGTPKETLTPETLARLYGEAVSYYEHDHGPGARDAI